MLHGLVNNGDSLKTKTRKAVCGSSPIVISERSLTISVWGFLQNQ